MTMNHIPHADPHTYLTSAQIFFKSTFDIQPSWDHEKTLSSVFVNNKGVDQPAACAYAQSD